MVRPSDNAWQILDVGSIWMREFASGLSEQTPTVAWWPEMVRLNVMPGRGRVERIANPPLDVHRFPLQRGYARIPIRWVARFEGRLLRRLLRSCEQPEETPLVCTTPFYAPVAERWPGPVVYYSTDLTHAYEGLHAEQVKALDRRLCRVATAVCPNSRRIADYFINEAECAPEKIAVVPNATRAGNIMGAPPQPRAGELPSDLQDVPRPIAGVLGDLSGNMNWVLTQRVIERTPKLSWVFVGPTNRAIADPVQSAAREWAKAHARFTGSKPYGELQHYARSFDVAVLPYCRKEPTYSGSSTRFYEHLAACRPMVATRGFAELLEKVPLLRLADTAEEIVEALEALREVDFEDGLEMARWEASKTGTWQARAESMLQVVARQQAPFFVPETEFETAPSETPHLASTVP